MLLSQELQLQRAILLRKANAEYSETREYTAEEKTNRTAIMADVERLDGQIIDAMRAEASETTTVFGADLGEHREAVEATRKADLGVMVGNILTQRNMAVGSAEEAAQDAWRVDGSQVPAAMLFECRAIDAPDSGGPELGTLGYVFGASIAGPANIARPAVAAGEHVYPSFTSGAAGTRTAIGTDNADQDPTLRGELLTPKRVQANTQISIEDAARLPGLGAAVARHLAGAVVAGLAARAVSDEGGFFDATNGPLGTAPTDPGAASTFALYMSMFAGAVDGRHAPTQADVTMIVGSSTFADAAVLYRGNNSDESVTSKWARLGRAVVSPSIPAASSNIQSILIAKGSAQAAVQPLWPGIDITDVYSDSKKGLVSFTAVALQAFSVQHPSAYDWQKANLS